MSIGELLHQAMSLMRHEKSFTIPQVYLKEKTAKGTAIVEDLKNSKAKLDVS